MKKTHKNMFIFLAFLLLVVTGLYGNCVLSLISNTGVFLGALTSGNIKRSISILKNTNDISTEKLLYHDQLVDINSLKNNLSHTRFMSQHGNTVKCESDMLAMINEERFDQEYINQVADKISDLQEKSEACGANFLYLAVPEKGYYQTFPSNIIDYSKVNFDDYLDCLQQKNIPVLSYLDEFKKRNMQNEDIYYYTDTHWTTNVGFLAAKLACESMNERYGIKFDNSKLDLNNYNQKLYHDWFLGALGKKVGTWFTWKGADDFNLITPKFETYLIEEKPYEDSIRKGSFDETALYMKQIEEKDYYHHDPYSGYSGGNHRLQIFRNQMENNGKKALFIRDSFSHVVTPYFALQFKELHVVDTRGEDIELYDEKVNWYEYMEKIKPDIVMVLYKGVPYKTMLDFEAAIK